MSRTRKVGSRMELHCVVTSFDFVYGPMIDDEKFVEDVMKGRKFNSI